MEKKITKISFLIMILGIIIWNNKVMPVRKQLTDMYLVRINGMDVIDDGIYKAEKTIVKLGEKEKDSSSTSSSSGQSSNSGGDSKNPNEGNKNISVKAISFAETVRSFQTYTDKTIAGSHIKYFICGEELAKQNMELAMDFDIRDYEVRTNADIYISKSSSAKDFLNKVTTGSYELDKKLEGMEKNNESKGVYHKTTITDILKIFAKENGTGLIPTLEIINNKTEEAQNKNIENDSSNTKIDKQTAEVETKNILFDFSGYGIIKDKKLIGYLDREESITSNILMNKFEGGNINLILDNNETVTCMIRNPKIKYKFRFNNNKLEEVMIIFNFKSNIEEVYANKNIFTEEMLLDLEKKQSQQMKSRIENILKKEVEYNTDFLDMAIKLKRSHPYKYMSIKDNFIEELKNAKITVEVNSFIRRTYDYVKMGG